MKQLFYILFACYTGHVIYQSFGISLDFDSIEPSFDVLTVFILMYIFMYKKNDSYGTGLLIMFVYGFVIFFKYAAFKNHITPIGVTFLSNLTLARLFSEEFFPKKESI